MHFSAALSDWDTILLMLPFFAVMALGMFRLDEKIATSSKQQQTVRQMFCGIDADGKVLLSDPDGRPLGINSLPARQRPAAVAARIDSRPIRGYVLRRGVSL
ncbi:MAG TPA: hypothetical protein VGG85_16515 [Terracidiphilus sp.]|jgi:hypothetical protein